MNWFQLSNGSGLNLNHVVSFGDYGTRALCFRLTDRNVLYDEYSSKEAKAIAKTRLIGQLFHS